MNGLLNPRWLYLLHGLPMLVLGGMGWRQYTLVESLLEPANHTAWAWVMGGWLLYLVVGFLLATVLDARREQLPWWGSTGLLLGGISFIYGTLWHMEVLLPWGLPGWLADGALPVYVLTFVMPSLVYSLLVMVVYLTPQNAQQQAWTNFVGALGVPVLGYIFGTAIAPLLDGQLGDVGAHVMVVLTVVATVAFLFLLLRGGYLVFTRRGGAMKNWRLAYLIPITLLFPLLGLALNNGHLGMNWLNGVPGSAGIFGDFSAPLYYLLAVTNGLLLCLPAREVVGYRLARYLGLCALLCYVLYFVLVFLPYLPFSLLIVVVFGLGLLMLAPLLLLPVQLVTLHQDYRFLSHYYSPVLLRGLAVTALLVLPILVTFEYLRDRHQLDRALDYVYASAEYDGKRVDPVALDRLLAAVSYHKETQPLGLFGGGTPYLSTYYNWLVLDNLTLSDDKISTLNSVFFGRHRSAPTARERLGQTDWPAAELIGHTISSTYDSTGRHWVSWVELELTYVADSLDLTPAEYETTFSLPTGTFIDDYYLYINQEKKHGILSERRSAVWVYQQITAGQRDPGLLRYVSADRVRLSVFPFTPGERRRTGIHLIHAEPSRIIIDGRSITLGDTTATPLQQPVRTANGTTYLPAATKRAGPQVQRQPQVHFIVDGSRQYPDFERTLAASLDSFLRIQPAPQTSPRITLAGTYPQTLDYDDDWAKALEVLPPGGFFAQRAVEDVLHAAYERPSATTYPVIVIVGRHPTYTEDITTHLAAAIPELPQLYHLTETGKLLAYRGYQDFSLEGNGSAVSSVASAGPVRSYTTYEGKVRYVPDDGLPSVLPALPGQPVIQEGRVPPSWQSALALRGQYLDHSLRGDHSYTPWLQEVRGSFLAQALMPTTAYLVVENAAQEEALRRKQEEILEANPALDLSETTEMSEPGWWVLIVLCLLFAVKNRMQTKGRVYSTTPPD